MNQTPLDLAQINIRPFLQSTVMNRFDCGKAPMNKFLKNKAKKCQARNELRVFCAHLGASVECIGYHALRIGSDSVADLPGVESTYLKNHTAFPAVHLAYVAVDLRYQRKGLGGILLMDVFTRVAEIASNAGLYALTLQSHNADSTEFYKSLGFTVYSNDVAQPKMLYPLDSILDLVNA